MRSLSSEETESVPIRDVDGACQGNNYCITIEQDAYDNIKNEWLNVDVVSRNVCISIGNSSGNAEAFYRLVENCINARNAEIQIINSLVNKNHFKP